MSPHPPQPNYRAGYGPALKHWSIFNNDIMDGMIALRTAQQICGNKYLLPSNSERMLKIRTLVFYSIQFNQYCNITICASHDHN